MRYKFWGMRYKFWGMRYKFSGMRYKFSGVRYKFSGVRYKFSGMRYKFSGMRYKFWGTRYKFSGMRYKFQSMRYKFSGMRYKFRGMRYKLLEMRPIFCHSNHIGYLHQMKLTNGKLEHARGNLGKPKFNLYMDTPLKCLNIIKFPINQDTTLYSTKYLEKSSYHLYLALFIVEWLIEFVQQFDGNKKLGIVTPYRAQSDLIYKLVNVNYKKLNGNEVLVSTIHGFQGDECDIIICAFNPPRSKNQKVVINDKNVINVAISRAKDHLILFIPENYAEYSELKKIVSIIITQKISNNSVDAKVIENELFQSKTYFENISYTTAHHPINVFGASDYKYEIRIEDDAIDIQINENH